VNFSTLDNIKKTKPLVHSLTNYVTSNDCANILYAIGAKPVMADCILDIKEITPKCDALYINLGTLNKDKIKAINKAVKIANKNDIPVCLDPVGIGASSFRLKYANYLLKKNKVSVIKGNATEIKAFYYGKKLGKGVDTHDKTTNENIYLFINLAKDFAKKTSAIIVITGEIDLISDGEKTYLIKNGHKMMESITGSGCMLGALLSAFLGANKRDALSACASGVCAMGLCGEKAFASMKENDGNLSYRNYLIDEVFNLSQSDFTKGAKYEIR